MRQYTLNDLAETVAGAVEQDVARTKNQLRTWLAAGILPAAQTYGEGVGTRRVYDDTSACVAVALARLAQFGIVGDALVAKGLVLEKHFKSHITQQQYLVVLPWPNVKNPEARLGDSAVVDRPLDYLEEGSGVIALDLTGIRRRLGLV